MGMSPAGAVTVDSNAIAARSWFDAVVLFLVWTVPFATILLKITNGGSLVWSAIAIGPLIIGNLVAGLIVFQRAFRPQSRLRRAFGRVPAGYHLLAGLWLLLIVIPPLVVLDEPDPWGGGGWTSPLYEALGRPDLDSYWNAQDVVMALTAAAVVITTTAAWLFLAFDTRQFREPVPPTIPARRDDIWRVGVWSVSGAVGGLTVVALAIGPRVDGEWNLVVAINLLVVMGWPLALGTVVLTRALSARSPVRASRGSVPTRYPIATTLWAAVLLLAPVSAIWLLLNEVGIQLLALPALGVTFALWLMYRRDSRSRPLLILDATGGNLGT